MAITKAPPRIHTAYNPQQITANSPFTMSTVPPQVPTTIEIIDNQCDGQGVFQHAMSESRTYIAPEWVYYDHRVSGVYLIDATPYGVVNAVRQLYGDPDMSKLLMGDLAVLNSNREDDTDNLAVYRAYTGYPIDVNVLVGAGAAVRLTNSSGESATLPESLAASGGTYNPPVATVRVEPGGDITAGTGYYSLELIDTFFINPTGRLYYLQGIVYANGLHVAVGYPAGAPINGVIATSIDGYNWSVNFTNEEPIYFMDITFANNLFVAISSNGVFGYSSNGIDFTLGSITGSSSLNSIVFGAGYFVAVGSNSIFSISPNGYEWENISVSTRGINDVAFGNGVFIAVGSLGTLRSTDGRNWTSVNTGITAVKVVFTDNKFVIVGSRVSAVSTDGITWDTGVTPIGTTPNGLFHTDSAIIALYAAAGSGAQSRWASSVDGLEWVQGYTGIVGRSLYAGVFNGNYSVAVGASNLVGIFDTVFTPDPGGLSIQTRIVPCTIPDSQKFYVRWLNQNGGWDYQMFQINTRIQNRTTSQSVFEGYIEDIQNPENYLIVYDGESEFRAVTGSARVEKFEYDILQYIHQSPIIERYDKTLDKWIRIRLVANAQNEWNKDTRFGEVAFTFILEPVQKQYPGL